jgi:hypothetical protein
MRFIARLSGLLGLLFRSAWGSRRVEEENYRKVMSIPLCSLVVGFHLFTQHISFDRLSL